MFKIEIPDSAVYEEVQSRLDVDPSAIVFAPSRPRAMRHWGAVWFAFTAGVAMGWFLRF